MPLKYLADAFDLLELRPKIDAAARAKLKAQEAKYDFAFPAAVAEWLTHGGKGVLGRLLARARDNLKEVPWARLGAPVKVYNGTRTYDPVAGAMLPLVASQEWGYWAV